MQTKECPSCAMEVEVKSKTCPICGYEFARPNIVLKLVALLLALFFLLYMIIL